MSVIVPEVFPEVNTVYMYNTCISPVFVLDPVPVFYWKNLDALDRMENTFDRDSTTPFPIFMAIYLYTSINDTQIS